MRDVNWTQGASRFFISRAFKPETDAAGDITVPSDVKAEIDNWLSKQPSRLPKFDIPSGGSS